MQSKLFCVPWENRKNVPVNQSREKNTGSWRSQKRLSEGDTKSMKRIVFHYVEAERLQRQLFACRECILWNCAELSKAFWKSKWSRHIGSSFAINLFTLLENSVGEWCKSKLKSQSMTTNIYLVSTCYMPGTGTVTKYWDILK